MKNCVKFLAAGFVGAVAIMAITAHSTRGDKKVDTRVFELRTYHAAAGKMDALNSRFRDHTCALFKKHGMTIIGFWIPTDKEKGSENTLIYLLAHKSREEAKKSWAAFGSDPDWKK